MVNVRIEPLTERDAHEVASWRYDPPYDFYDADADPEDLAELLDPGRRAERYWAARDLDGRLLGFFYYAPRGDDVEIGLGLGPELTGLGLGLAFFRAGVDFARSRFRPGRVILNVASFNERAIKVYECAGFHITGRHVRSFDRWGDVEFTEMGGAALIPTSSAAGAASAWFCARR